MASYFLGRDTFAELIERATSEAIPAGSDDIMLNLEVADKIKGKDVAPEKAMRAIKARLEHRNPNVQLLALKLCDICVKNGGNHFLQQVSSKEFLDQLENMLRLATLNSDVRNKILTLVQSWALAFRSRPELSYVVDVYNRMRNMGYSFPPPDKTESSAAMIDTATAPEWTDSDVCERCRTSFSFTNRKHHCRNCGKTFCGSCSSKTEALPHFAITKPVRVCDTCWGRLQSGGGAAAAAAGPLATPATMYPGLGGGYTPPGFPDPRVSAYQSAAQSAISRMQAAAPASSSKEDDDLAKAIALSLEEASSSRPSRASAAPAAPVSNSSRSKEDEDLERAIAESLKDLESNRATATENVEAALKSTSNPPYVGVATESARDPNELNATEAENIRLFAQLVERLEQDAATRGAATVISDSSVQTLYNQIAALQPKLVKNVEESVQKYRAFADINTRIEGAMRTYDMMLQARLREAAYGSAAPGGYRRESYPAQSGYAAPAPAGPSSDYAAYSYAPAPVAQVASYPANPYPAAVEAPQPAAYPEQYPAQPGYYPATTAPAPSAGYDATRPQQYGVTEAPAPPGQYQNMAAGGAAPYGQPVYAPQPAAQPAPVEEEKPLIEF